MVVEDGFKRTEVGVLPVEWGVVRLDEVAEVRGGKRLPKGIFVQSEKTCQPYIRVSNMTESGIDVSDIRYVPEEVQGAIKNYRIFESDLYISVAGTLGLVGFIPAELNGANLTENADRITDIKCDKLYLLYCLKADSIQRIIQDRQTVGAQPKLAIKEIQSFLLPLPPLPEQRHIAAVLSDVDGLLAALDAVVAKKEAVKVGVMEGLLTGRRRLEGFRGEWKSVLFEDVMSGFSSGATPRRNVDDYYKGTIPWITSGELNYNIIKDTEEHISTEAVVNTNLEILDPGVFLMAITGLEAAGTRGSCGITGIRAASNQSCMALKPNPKYLELDYLFHYYVFAGNALALEYCQGTKQQSYTGAIVRQLPLPLPPLPEQRAIAAVLSAMDEELAVLRARRAKVAALRAGLLGDLLSGRVRV